MIIQISIQQAGENWLPALITAGMALFYTVYVARFTSNAQKLIADSAISERRTDEERALIRSQGERLYLLLEAWEKELRASVAKVKGSKFEPNATAQLWSELAEDHYIRLANFIVLLHFEELSGRMRQLEVSWDELLTHVGAPFKDFNDAYTQRFIDVSNAENRFSGHVSFMLRDLIEAVKSRGVSRQPAAKPESS